MKHFAVGTGGVLLYFVTFILLVGVEVLREAGGDADGTVHVVRRRLLFIVAPLLALCLAQFIWRLTVYS